VPLTVENVLPVTAYPAQFVLLVLAADAFPAPAATAKAATMAANAAFTV
jgi:hypothetical protein